MLVMGKHRRSKDERSLDVRVYDNVEILKPELTSDGVAYKIRFDVSRFRGVQWENSKRLIFGSLLCLSKDNFESFAFATVADRDQVKRVSISCERFQPRSHVISK